jgi:hypothetical protein
VTGGNRRVGRQVGRAIVKHACCTASHDATSLSRLVALSLGAGWQGALCLTGIACACVLPSEMLPGVAHAFSGRDTSSHHGNLLLTGVCRVTGIKRLPRVHGPSAGNVWRLPGRSPEASPSKISSGQGQRHLGEAPPQELPLPILGRAASHGA